MSSREQHYAKVREALTDALRKIETDDDDDDVTSMVMIVAVILLAVGSVGYIYRDNLFSK